MTSGTARPNACGQEITNTVTSRSTANAGSPRRAIHAMNVTAPAAMAAMVSQNAARSARACAREREDLCLLDQAHDPGKRGPFARPRDLNPERAGPVDRPGDHALAPRLLHRPRLAGDHRLVDLAVALHDRSVGRNTRTWAHQDRVSDRERADRDFLDLVALNLEGGVRQQFRQFMQGTLRLGDGPHLDPVTQ